MIIPRKPLVFLVALLTGLANLQAESQVVDLAGDWKFALDARDLGLKAGPATWSFPDSIKLPGTTAAQRKGEALEIQLNLEKPAMQHLHQRFPYTGPAWYQRSISIPPDWKGKDIILTLERVLWESRVWIDQRPVGTPQNSVSTPHRYDLSSALTPGKQHTITLRIDNRQQVDIGTIGHAYTEETQTIWNGIIGDLKLEALPRVRTAHLGIRTLPHGKGLRIDLELLNTTNLAQSSKIRIYTTTGGKSPMVLAEFGHLIQPGTNVLPYNLQKLPDQISAWSEFNPSIHQIGVVVTSPKSQHITTKDFGLRTFTRKDRHFLVNGKETFLRGNLECAIFPQTGHPDATGEQWEKIMTVSRDYGLNHLRFHSWCPPQAAFEAADRHGIYLQVELPNWTFEMGRKSETDAFLKTEGERILREFGHHPSFVMFSLGNELKGDLNHMDRLIEHFRKLAPDLLYTSTSYAFSPRGLRAGPQDDFFITQKSASGWVRGQGFLNTTFPTTDSDYAEGLSSVTTPLVTHEVGQYVVYPNLAELPKYANTPLRPTALESIKADLKAKNLLTDASRFTRDSGKLAALLYKEDIERALRTKDLAGIQLLQLQDFPGQSTATVGLLDAFWDSKGLIGPDRFRQFSSPVVPLARMKKFVWENTETFVADLELANFGFRTLEGAAFTATLSGPTGETIATTNFDAADFPLGNGLSIGRFTTRLSGITTPTKLKFSVHLPDSPILNTWPIWVYPAKEPATGTDFITHRGVTTDCLADLAAGKNVLLLPPSGAIKKALPARFIPVFWSPLHFPNQPGTLGATIDTDHPLWENFPTDTHTHWQWWELTANSTAVDLTGLDRDIGKPFRFVDKYNRNALPTAIFETNVGPGNLLVCTLDVETKPTQRIVARQLHRALQKRIVSPDFNPTGNLTPAQLSEIIGESSFTISAGSAHPDFPAQLAADGDPNTIWHSDWRGEPKLPISLTLDLLSEKIVSGFTYLPRQDQANGRLKNYHIEVSTDGEKWVKLASQETFPNTKEMQSVDFQKPIKTRYIRLVASSEHNGNPYASCAEWQPVFADPDDVRDLGIIPGFNDSSE